MELYTVILRIIHIVGGVFWVGFGAFQVMYLLPAMKATGSTGGRFYASLPKRPPLGAVMGISALLTTLAGILLYLDVYGHSILPTVGGYVLILGSVVGVLAFGHGAGALGPTSGKLDKAAAELVAAGDNPDQALVDEVDRLSDKLIRNGRISLALTIIALLCMASARYLVIPIG